MTNPPTATGTVPTALVVAAGWAWRILVLVAFIALTAIIAYRLRIVTVPVFAALLATTLLLPLVHRLQRSGMKAGLATALVIVGSVLLMAGVVYAMASPVASQFRDLGPQVSEGVADVQNWLTTGPLELSDADLDRYVDSVSAELSANSGKLRAGVLSSAVLIGELLVGILLTIVLTAFFVKDHELIARSLVNLFPPHRRQLVQSAGSRAFHTLGAYLRGVAMTGIVDAVLIGIALGLIGVPLLLPLVVLTFLGAFFPVVGATIAGVLAALVALVSGGPGDAGLVLLAVVVVQQLEGHLLQPLLVGRAVHMHPIVIIVALTSGGIVAGMLGAFCAVPIVAMIASVLREVHEQTDLDETPVGLA